MSEPAEPSLDEINRRLAVIDAALDGVNRDPSSEQYALLVERDRLRALASKYRAGRDEGRPTTDLRSELESLRRALRIELTARTGYITSKGGGTHSPSPGAWVKLAALSREESPISRLRARIGAIESELERRAGTEAGDGRGR